MGTKAQKKHTFPSYHTTYMFRDNPATPKKVVKKKKKNKEVLSMRKPSFECFGSEEFPCSISNAKHLGENIFPAKRGKIISEPSKQHNKPCKAQLNKTPCELLGGAETDLQAWPG